MDLIFEKESYELLLKILDSAGQLDKSPAYKDLVTTKYAQKAVS